MSLLILILLHQRHPPPHVFKDPVMASSSINVKRSAKELFFWTLFKHVLSMFSTCFVTVSSEFSHIHRFRFRRWLLPCPSAPTLCVRTCEAAELVPVNGTSTPRGHGLWLQVDHVIVVSLWYVLFVNSGLVMHTKAISHWCQSCCLFLNMAVLGIYLWFQTIWQTKQCWLESTPWKDCMSSWKGYIVPVRNFSLSEGTLHSVHYVVNMSMGYVLSLFK